MIDLSPKSVWRVYLVTFVGTITCIGLAFAIDGYSRQWQWSDTWLNNIMIPLVIAPPFFYFLLSKLRELSIAHEKLSMAHDELLRIASRDPLTDCLNRRAFSTLIEAFMEKLESQDTHRKGALLILDVDNFKTVNDLFGHDQGDVALQLIADIVRLNVREIDLVSRLGGEEFGVFLPHTDEQSARYVAERIRKAVQDAYFAPEGQRHQLSLSIGGVIFDPPKAFLQLYREADRRLYEAKHAGRNRTYIAGQNLGTMGQ